MKRSSVENWSVFRSLAFLAAVFAMSLAIGLPTVVAASAATGSPIMLCSGEQMIVSVDADGVPQVEKPTAADSLVCAACVLSGLASLPPPPPTRPAAPPRIVTVHPAIIAESPAPQMFLIGWRPPATAPPIA